jgi:hypothetical protein
MMYPPKTNSTSIALVLDKLMCGEDALLECNRDAMGAVVYARRCKHLPIAEMGKVKRIADVSELGGINRCR